MQFSESDRNIFPYRNGERDVLGDPLRLRRRIIQEVGDESLLVDQINAAEADGADLPTVIQGCNATDILVGGIRRAFGMADWDDASGKGANDNHVLGVYRAFCDFLKKKETSTDSGQTSSLPTGSISEIPNTAAS